MPRVRFVRGRRPCGRQLPLGPLLCVLPGQVPPPPRGRRARARLPRPAAAPRTPHGARPAPRRQRPPATLPRAGAGGGTASTTGRWLPAGPRSGPPCRGACNPRPPSRCPSAPVARRLRKRPKRQEPRRPSSHGAEQQSACRRDPGSQLHHISSATNDEKWCQYHQLRWRRLCLQGKKWVPQTTDEKEYDRKRRIPKSNGSGTCEQARGCGVSKGIEKQ